MVGAISTRAKTGARGSTRTDEKIHKMPKEEDDVNTGLISNNCCFLTSCIDLNESDLRSTLLHFLGYEDEDKHSDTDTDTVSSDGAEDKGSGNNNRNINKETPQVDKQNNCKTNSRVMSSSSDKNSVLSNQSRKKQFDIHDQPKVRTIKSFTIGLKPKKQHLPKTLSLQMPKSKSQKQARSLKYIYNINNHVRTTKVSNARSVPPPVIALSRSSFSTNSESSDDSSLAATEFESSYSHTVTPERHRLGDKSGCQDETNDDGCADTDGMGGVGLFTKYGISGSGNERNYAALHELLVNSLFEDAKRRQNQQIQEEIMLEQSAHAASEISSLNQHQQQPISSPPSSYHTPPRRTSNRNQNHNGINLNPHTAATTSDKSVSSKTSSRISSSSQSHTSELLTPSSHRFQKTLKTHRHINLPRFRKGHYFSKMRRGGNNPTSGGKGQSRLISPPKLSSSNLPNASPNQSDFSACSGSMTTLSRIAPTVKSFLDENVRLQKDSGKGVEIGKKISANGIEEALQKLNDKMDVLAEVDRDGKWANATLTRIPAKDMRASEQKDPGMDQKGFVETRSMLAVKLGFVSLKYGVLVYWNVHTGLAELILLRKSCPESFMKSSPTGKKKGKTWKKKRKNSCDMSDKEMDERGSLQTPCFVTVNSAPSDDNSYGSLGLEPVASAHI